MAGRRLQAVGGGDERKQIRDLMRRVEKLERRSSLRGASISGGDLVVRGGGDLLLEDADGTIVWRASEDPTKTTWASVNNSGLSIPNVWTVMGYESRPVPVGFDGQGHFLMAVSVGDTMTDTGSVSVQPVVRLEYKDGSLSPWFGGPAIASPDNRITVATSFWASNFGTSKAAAIQFGVNAVRSFGTESPGNGNWHLAASVIFKRSGELS